MMIHTADDVQLVVGTGLDVGRGRSGKPNQDAVGSYAEFPVGEARVRRQGHLFVVADGMGGAAAGEVASEMAVRLTISAYYAGQDGDAPTALKGAIQSAARQIYECGHGDPTYQGMGTTIVAVAIHGTEAVIAHVGDSRAYLLRRGALRQLTEDHSVVQEQVRRGILTAEQALSHPSRSVLSRNLGFAIDVDPDLTQLSLQEGDTFLLCSDGIWSVIPDGELGDVLQAHEPAAAAQALVDLANERGGPDNIGLVIVRVARLGGVDADVQTATTAGSTTPEQLAREADTEPFPVVVPNRPVSAVLETDAASASRDPVRSRWAERYIAGEYRSDISH